MAWLSKLSLWKRDFPLSSIESWMALQVLVLSPFRKPNFEASCIRHSKFRRQGAREAEEHFHPAAMFWRFGLAHFFGSSCHSEPAFFAFGSRLGAKSPRRGAILVRPCLPEPEFIMARATSPTISPPTTIMLRVRRLWATGLAAVRSCLG